MFDSGSCNSFEEIWHCCDHDYEEGTLRCEVVRRNRIRTIPWEKDRASEQKMYPSDLEVDESGRLGLTAFHIVVCFIRAVRYGLVQGVEGEGAYVSHG